MCAVERFAKALDELYGTPRDKEEEEHVSNL